MKPLFTNGKLEVELHEPDKRALDKARAIGQALTAMNQDTGAPLVAAIDAIMPPIEEVDEDTQKPF